MSKLTTPTAHNNHQVPEANRPGHEPDVQSDKPLAVPAAYRVEPPVESIHVRHQFRFDLRFYAPAAVFGVVPHTTYVEIEGGQLRIRFGPWSLETPVDNIATAETTGPYPLITVLGPPHLGLGDLGVTFATNADLGLCLRFHEPVPAVEPFGLVAHPAATVTVADPLALGRDLDLARQ